MNRKEFIKRSVLLGAGLSLPLSYLHSQVNPETPLRHLLPVVNHSRMLITASSWKPLSRPQLHIGRRKVRGVPQDSQGLHWIFDVPELEAATTYELSLRDGRQKLCEDWTLRTFPAPNQMPERLRLLVYTCAGGHPQARLPLEERQESPEQFASRRLALLKRGLSFQPDAVVAIGDQVYWDLGEIFPGALGIGEREAARRLAGTFNPDLPIIGSPNEAVLKAAVGPQIADLYGLLCKGTPVFMVPDDHDYFANDMASPSRVTFPPNAFHLRLARQMQRMYWPAFLPDETRPPALSGAGAPDQPPGISEVFGSLRYGRLAELLLYDCRRFATLSGPSAGLVPLDAERWLLNRTRSDDTLYTLHAPSLPIGWSAGKWMEWYPDVRNEAGELTAQRSKYLWQEGWRSQHDRLLHALCQQTHKPPIILNGDLHTFASGTIHRSGEWDFEKNPIHTCIVGTLGSTVFPSAARGVKAGVPTHLGMEEAFENVEENGFSLVDISEDGVDIRMYKALTGRDSLTDITTLAPFHHIRISR